MARPIHTDLRPPLDYPADNIVPLRPVRALNASEVRYLRQYMEPVRLAAATRDRGMAEALERPDLYERLRSGQRDGGLLPCRRPALSLYAGLIFPLAAAAFALIYFGARELMGMLG